MTQWYAIIDEATGRLESIGSVVADILPLGFIKVPIDEPRSDQMWNEKLMKFTPRPVPIIVDRVDDFYAHPGVSSALQTLTFQDLQVIKEAIAKILGERRYRSQSTE